MNFPDTHPAWMWLYFGLFGTIGIALFILTMWTIAKLRRNTPPSLRRALRWNLFGYLCLFIASWFACGIGGPPGNLLSQDLQAHNRFAALAAAATSMFFSLPGWGFLLLGYRAMLRDGQE